MCSCLQEGVCPWPVWRTCSSARTSRSSRRSPTGRSPSTSRFSRSSTRATSDYIDGIISNAKEFGPYFVICPDLALLHARPEQGVIKRQLAVTVLREPVRFKEEGPDVRLLVTLAAEDADSHIDVMRKLAVMFSDPADITKIAKAMWRSRRA